MNATRARIIVCALVLSPIVAAEEHDITKVDPAAPGTVIATPIPEKQRRQMKKYEIPELAGARQALGSQLIDGQLPRPILDYVIVNANVEQRLSIFEKGLVVIRMTGAAGSTMLKRVILPDEALKAYLRSATPDHLAAIRNKDVTPPETRRRSTLRIYRENGEHVELAFDPVGVIPKPLGDEIRPIEDLFRALSEDRRVSNTVADYRPAVGDELVSDDRKTWRVERVMNEIVELHCVGQPQIIYVDKKDLYNYFVGKRAGGQ
jgi:hypothetical protein